MSRILIVSDLHYNKAAFRWVKERAHSDGMAAAIVGDLMDLNRCDNELDAHRQQSWLLDWINGFELPIFVCSGNHDVYPSRDWAEWLVQARRPGVAVDGDVVSWSGRSIALCPYNSGSNRILDQLSAGRPPDILLHHEPPAETELSVGFRDYADFGSDQLAAALSGGWHPKVVVSGHIHRPAARHQFLGSALCLNVAGDPRLSPPCHSILDSDTGVIEFFTPAPREIAMNPDW